MRIRVGAWRWEAANLSAARGYCWLLREITRGGYSLLYHGGHWVSSTSQRRIQVIKRVWQDFCRRLKMPEDVSSGIVSNGYGLWAPGRPGRLLPFGRRPGENRWSWRRPGGRHGWSWGRPGRHGRPEWSADRRPGKHLTKRISSWHAKSSFPTYPMRRKEICISHRILFVLSDDT